MSDRGASDRATRSVMRPFHPWTTLMIAEGRAVATRRRRRLVSGTCSGAVEKGCDRLTKGDTSFP